MTLRQPSGPPRAPNGASLLSGEGVSGPDPSTDLEQVPVGACSNMPAAGPRSGRVLVAGELLSGDEARALAGRLCRAADELDRILAAGA